MNLTNRSGIRKQTTQSVRWGCGNCSWWSAPCQNRVAVYCHSCRLPTKMTNVKHKTAGVFEMLCLGGLSGTAFSNVKTAHTNFSSQQKLTKQLRCKTIQNALQFWPSSILSEWKQQHASLNDSSGAGLYCVLHRLLAHVNYDKRNMVVLHICPISSRTHVKIQRNDTWIFEPEHCSAKNHPTKPNNFTFYRWIAQPAKAKNCCLKTNTGPNKNYHE